MISTLRYARCPSLLAAMSEQGDPQSVHLSALLSLLGRHTREVFQYFSKNRLPKEKGARYRVFVCFFFIVNIVCSLHADSGVQHVDVCCSLLWDGWVFTCFGFCLSFPYLREDAASNKLRVGAYIPDTTSGRTYLLY